MDADQVITVLGLRSHPEGGWYRETWREPVADSERPASTAIYYLLRAGERSHWHRVDATETWYFHAGDPLMLETATPAAGRVDEHLLGADLATNQRPQAIVPANYWQRARPLGAWTLVSCTVAPGFRFDGFELAPPGWQPLGASE